jgi:hypothetical protein
MSCTNCLGFGRVCMSNEDGFAYRAATGPISLIRRFLSEVDLFAFRRMTVTLASRAALDLIPSVASIAPGTWLHNSPLCRSRLYLSFALCAVSEKSTCGLVEGREELAGVPHASGEINGLLDLGQPRGGHMSTSPSTV